METNVITRIDWKDRQAGDVGLVRGVGLISDAIIEGERMAHEVGADGKAWSHAYIVANGAILEAIWPKITLSKWDVYDKFETVIFRVGLVEDAETDDPSWQTKLAALAAAKQTALLELIHEYVGQGYDLTGSALGMAGIEIMHALDLPVAINIFASQNMEWCSELATRYLDKILPDTFDPENPTTVDPQQMYNFLIGLTVPPSRASTIFSEKIEE